jgi:hypothetical protein
MERMVGVERETDIETQTARHRKRRMSSLCVSVGVRWRDENALSSLRDGKVTGVENCQVSSLPSHGDERTLCRE